MEEAGGSGWSADASGQFATHSQAARALTGTPTTGNGLPGAQGPTPQAPQGSTPHLPVCAAHSEQSFAVHLFSGPSSRADSFAAHCKQLGFGCRDFDTINGEMQNLACDLTWQRVRAVLQEPGCVGAVMGPPCNTFSHARTVAPGPPPLRTVEHLYGLPGLTPSQKEQVRTANLLAARSAEAATLLHGLGKGFVIENPERWSAQSPSIWALDEMQRVAALPGVRMLHFDQCTVGAPARKPTTLMYYRLDLRRLQARCNHPVREWTNPDGSTHRGAHPRTVQRQENGQWATKALAAYPAQLNRILAEALGQGATASN